MSLTLGTRIYIMKICSTKGVVNTLECIDMQDKSLIRINTTYLKGFKTEQDQYTDNN